MQNLRLRTRILLGYLPPVGLFILLGGAVYLNVLNKEKLQERVVRSQDAIVEANKASLGLSRMVRNIRGQVIFPKDTSYQESFAKGNEAFQQASLKIEQLIQDPQQKERLNKMKAEVDKVRETSEQIFEELKAGQSEKAAALVKDVQPDQFETLYAELLEKEQAALVGKAEQDKAAGNFLLVLITVGTAAAAMSSAIVSWLIASSINQALQKAASKITASSSEIAATMEQQERIANQQAASVSETTTTMDELEASFRQSSEQAKAAATAAQQVLQLTEDGNQAMGENLERMFALEQQVGEIAEQMLQLSEQATQIGSISQLVSDLANQTNMLALNSSVEAVRAGEHGKGFAVVANEIRKLADQSQRSADKIGVLVADIQTAINSTVMTTEEGTKTVATGVQSAKKTEQVLTEVADAVNHVVLNNQQISLNLKQQLDGVQQVVEAMEVINQGARQTASGISQTKVGTQQLNEAAQELKQVV